jgi:hypothetical protein
MAIEAVISSRADTRTLFRSRDRLTMDEIFLRASVSLGFNLVDFRAGVVATEIFSLYTVARVRLRRVIIKIRRIKRQNKSADWNR